MGSPTAACGRARAPRRARRAPLRPAAPPASTREELLRVARFIQERGEHLPRDVGRAGMRVRELRNELAATVARRDDLIRQLEATRATVSTLVALARRT